jgi:hypothetical protein
MIEMNRTITYIQTGLTGEMKKGVLIGFADHIVDCGSSGVKQSPCAIVEDATGQVKKLDLGTWSIKFTDGGNIKMI